MPIRPEDRSSRWYFSKYSYEGLETLYSHDHCVYVVGVPSPLHEGLYDGFVIYMSGFPAHRMVIGPTASKVKTDTYKLVEVLKCVPGVIEFGYPPRKYKVRPVLEDVPFGIQAAFLRVDSPYELPGPAMKRVYSESV